MTRAIALVPSPPSNNLVVELKGEQTACAALVASSLSLLESPAQQNAIKRRRLRATVVIFFKEERVKRAIEVRTARPRNRPKRDVLVLEHAV
jgi:hypothetical protein